MGCSDLVHLWHLLPLWLVCVVRFTRVTITNFRGGGSTGPSRFLSVMRKRVRGSRPIRQSEAFRHPVSLVATQIRADISSFSHVEPLRRLVKLPEVFSWFLDSHSVDLVCGLYAVNITIRNTELVSLVQPVYYEVICLHTENNSHHMLCMRCMFCMASIGKVGQNDLWHCRD